MNYALMIIDLQKAFYSGPSKESMDSACEYINAILPSFRKTKSPIIWIQDKDKENGVVPGTEGFDFIDALTPAPGEYRIHKEYVNGFNKTECSKILKDHNTGIVVITGYCAEYCVLSTYRGAQDHDFLPVLLRGAIAGGNEAHIAFVEKISNVISYTILEKLLEDQQ